MNPSESICRPAVALLVLSVLAVGLVPSVRGQLFTPISFSEVSRCGEIGVGPQFQASGLTTIYYVAHSVMVMYVVDLPTLQQWGTTTITGPYGGPITIAMWTACAPSSGNWVRYSLGTGYDNTPLSGSIQLNLPANTYFVVFVDQYTTNPNASMAAG